jgi:hypothetical protein
MRSDRPNEHQVKLAALLRIDVSGDCESVAAARLQDAVAPALLDRAAAPSSVRQIEFGASLGLDLSSDTLRVASAKIDQALYYRNLMALRTLDLRSGDRVVKRDTYEMHGTVHVLEHEFVVSSIEPNSLRVWFRGGNGQGAWPTQLRRLESGGSSRR